MNLVAPVASAAAFNAVRRLLNEESGALRSPAPVAAVVALADETGGETAAAVLPGRLAGRVVPATVITRLDAGSGVVDIGGERVAVRAQLPAAGEPVNLRFPASQSAAPTASIPATVASAATLAPQTTASAVSLGPLAQTLAEVASAPLAPLDLGRIAAPPSDPRAFAAALAEQVRDSGAFYESHLERWSRGDYPLEAIRREPQAGGAADTRPALHPAATDTPAALATAGAQGIDAVTQPIVREQLDLIENRCLSVALEAWPGQRVDLEIVDEREGRSGRGDPEGAWSTRLGLELPNLGRVEARLALAGNRLRLAVRAADPDALESRGTDLAVALKGAGITLTSFRIDRDPDA